MRRVLDRSSWPNVPSRAARDQLRAAVFFMVAASALVAATSILAKALSLPNGGTAGLHPLQVSAGRFTFALVALSVFWAAVPSGRVGFKGTLWGLHAARVLCGWLGITAMFAAVAQMPVAEATAITFLSPMVTVALAAVLLSERLGLRKVLAAGIALLGAALILKPGTDAFQLAGLFALAAAGLMGSEAIIIKKLSDREPPMRILIVNNAMGSVIAVTAASFVWIAPAPMQWSGMATLGVVMVVAQTCFIQSLRRADATDVMPVFYSVLVFATLYDAALYDVWPDGVALLGAVLIVGGAVWVARR